MLEQNTNDLLHLFDKHLKSGDNFLPFKAFLQHIEKPEGDLNGFQAISTSKVTNSPRNTEFGKSQYFASSTKLIKSKSVIDNPILAHILYKVIITVDYWPQSSSLDFIKKSLNIIFDKINKEFNQFYLNCAETEPQIYITVLLWNSAPNYSSQIKHPFLTIIHSKRLIKTNISEMATLIFNKIVENKFVILDSFKETQIAFRLNTPSVEENCSKSKTRSPYEEFLRILLKIFNFFEVSSNSLVLAHHVHITDGFIYANDMVRCLEKISKSAISFSFVYTGTSSHKSERNIQSSFGHMVNCTFMKNLANMTNGFCFYLDENLEISEIIPRFFLYFFDLKCLDLKPKESKATRDKKSSQDLNNLSQMLQRDSDLSLMSECELAKDLDLMQFIRIRSQEGFYLANLNRNTEPDNCSTDIYLKKTFTQTVSLIYKIKSVLNQKYTLQLWMAWDSVQFKAKHQNAEALRKLKQFYKQMQVSIQEHRFEVTASMREPPEILYKYKEPLYKLSNENLKNENFQKKTISLQNLNFELNNRTIKNHEVDYYNEFAHCWSNLSFLKLSPKVLNRYFNIHSIKMILHHDRPIPDVNSCIFDLKSRNTLDSFNPNYIPNSIFQSTKAINELRSQLTSWCDIMLFENCIFLKFFHSSSYYLGSGENQEDNQEAENGDETQEKQPHTNKPTNANNLDGKNSFVICILNDQYAPYVSLQFLFNSNIFFIDRMQILYSFKKMLKNFNSVNDKELGLTKDTKETEQIILLHKSNLYDAFKFILFDEIQNNSDPKLNQSSKLVNFMLKKKFKWTLDQNFSPQTAQNLKETIIDTFIRVRMKEGFKCLFQCSKFVAFTLQLSMLDSTESNTSPSINYRTVQTCTFIYVIRLHKSDSSNLFNVDMQAQCESNQDDEVYFVTEIYAENIDGVYKERTCKKDHMRKKDRIEYFKNLTNNEILNMIYLQDFKCFSILQSSFALFFSKNNLYENLNELISKSELSVVIENEEIKDMLKKILSFEDKFYDCIRLVPDLNVILYKHLLKELGKKSTLINPITQCLINRVGYQSKLNGKKDTKGMNQLCGTLATGSESFVAKKKNLTISLYEQLRPVLSAIDVSRFSLNQVNFNFSLKGILIESSLFVCVYDDIPFNLFNSNFDDGFKKIQQYFFKNADETFRKIDDSKDNSLLQSVVHKIKSDVKNSLMLKLNDINSGDLITKRILEYLRQTENYDSFKIFIKFNIHHTTSKNISSFNSNSNRTSNSQKSNPWMSHFQLINPQYDIENNKFFIYGLFFINLDKNSEQCEPRAQDSNRLVFFLFNSVSESLKSSLIHAQSNSYLIRKSLFTTANSPEYKFYISKNTIAKTVSSLDLKRQQIQLRKLSDILKQNLSLNNQNDNSFLSMIDLIEENCAKTYVNSIVQFLANGVNDDVSIDKATVQRLLRLGAKYKIDDIDLTDIVRITCAHFKDNNTEEPCSNEQANYLHKKFEEIFLKRFQTIPGINDLFIIRYDCLNNTEMISQVEDLNDEFSPSEEIRENELRKINFEDKYFEAVPDLDLKDLMEKKTKKNVETSSPNSNLNKNVFPSENFGLTKEQVIGIEVICLVSRDPIIESHTGHTSTNLSLENNEPNVDNCISLSAKFFKFDFNCILKLINKKDLDLFKNLLSNIPSCKIDDSIKIFLRFNLYSFNELNLNYPLSFFGPSSSQQNVVSGTSNHSSMDTQINLENFAFLKPCINDLKWHLKEEQLNNETKMDSSDKFREYVNHIQQGVDSGQANCLKYEKIFLSKSIMSRTNSNMDGKTLKLNKAGKNPWAVQMCDEEKCLITIDSLKRFFTELSSHLIGLNFYQSQVQNLESNLFFMHCNCSQLNFKIFLIVRLVESKMSSERNASSSPSHGQEGTSSPNSQSKAQKMSTNDMSKFYASKIGQSFQETTINEVKMRVFFSFNDQDLSAQDKQKKTVEQIVGEFDLEMSNLVRLCYLKLTLKDINESHKWNNSLVLSEDKNLSFTESNNSLECSCVWSVYFKLHRLHQTLQKVHETNNYISQGLSKLRDCLHNFKIYESACADLYVYTKNTSDVFLLKLEEVYEEDERRHSSALSRRPSYASITDSESTIVASRNASNQGLKSQNLSGGTHRVETQTSLGQQSALVRLNPPEYVKLSVYGIEEPDDQMKKELCKTLQSELDYCLLNRMSNSIEKNTYKTTSQQHPDKINDEDINFFKQVSDNFLDFEVALPFLLNFNRTLREIFLFFAKQIFSANFKSIDPIQLAKTSNQDSQEAKYSNADLSQFYIPENKHFAKKNVDSAGPVDAVLVSRIFFQNSKSKRIGKQNVSLVLAEAFYSIRGLDTTTNRVTRSNSMGASSIKFEPDSLDKKVRQTGPSFVFKFYAKGDSSDIGNYKTLLKTAVQDALTYFLSDYITRIDPIDYTRKILVKKQTAKFRVLDSDFMANKLHRKRHKSTGTTELSSNKHFLQMNKTARESKLGRVLLSQNMSDTAQFNSFVLNNFSTNTFDHKDHEDTLQYFKQTRRILNICCQDSDESATSDSDDETNLYKVQRSVSMEPDLEKNYLYRMSNEKIYLKLIYEWFKGVNSKKICSLGSFFLKRQFVYKSKYNLTNLIKDFEFLVKELCKFDLNVNYFAFKKDAAKDSSRMNDSVFFDEDDIELDELIDLEISKLSMIGSNLSKGKHVIVTINAEYTGLSGFSSMSSSMNSSGFNHQTRLLSSTNSSSTLVQAPSNVTMSTAMVKSITSANGDLEVSSQNIKRIFCYIVVNSRSKVVTFFCFTTESANYDALKQWLDQTSDIITQRFHLVNNTVLYKFGGLIGDNIITDLKKVKQLAVSSTCCLSDAPSASQSDLFITETKQHTQRTQLTSIKLSKSPTIHRQSSCSKNFSSPINPSLIANLQFNSVNFTQAPSNSTPNQVSSTHQQTAFSLKQLYMSPFGLKSYDSIVTIINQQVNFCVQNLGQQTPSSNEFSIISPSSAKFLSQNPKIQCMFGVGMCYQLLEMQQIYRHPRKIYELAIGSGSLQNISPNSQNNLKPQNKLNTTNTNLVSPNNQIICKFSLSDFYKNSIQPVFIPFHYCCTPLLFYSNWNESITNEKMLKSTSFKPTKTNSSISNSENWYFKMRQIVLIEYSKYFESKGFIRLKDERQIQDTRISQSEAQMLHFIKWLQQDGFLYLTINLEEIYLHVRVGVCCRYRSSNRQSFISDIVRFLTQEFHVHSFIYDFHLSAINSNFLSTSQSGMQISQTSYIVSKFLDEFVEFFSRVPLYSQNKVFKLVKENSDNSLKQNQITVLFDLISYANRKLGTGNMSFQTLHTFGNNLTIYSLNDSSNCSKYLIVKLEQFSKEILKNKLNCSQNINKTCIQAIGTEKSQMENFIRITCFYLFINTSNELGSFANHGIINSLNNDLEFINRVIEESLSMHRQNVFWDNLAFSMNSEKSELRNKIEISDAELEKILSISDRINVLELDPGLDEFMKQCFQVKEKIKDFFRLELSRNFIYTESDSTEYCLMIVTDFLIKRFNKEYKDEKNGSDNYLNSFILVKFDKIRENTELFQVNRVKIVNIGGNQSDFKTSNNIRDHEYASRKIDQVISSLYRSKLFKSFAFIINILMCSLWNSLF